MIKWQELSNGDHFLSLSPILKIRIRKSTKYTIDVNDMYLHIDENGEGFDDPMLAREYALKYVDQLLGITWQHLHTDSAWEGIQMKSVSIK